MKPLKCQEAEELTSLLNVRVYKYSVKVAQ